MDDNIYAITLADGTVVENLKLNGNYSPIVISNET